MKSIKIKTADENNVILDVLRNTMIINGESNPLSKNECLLIKYLYEKQGSLISRGELIQHCWPGRVVSAASLPVAIKHIRDVLKKIKNEEIIKTHKGEGYSFLPGIVEIRIINSHPEDKTVRKKKPTRIKINKTQIQFFLTTLMIGTNVFFWGMFSFVIYTSYTNNIKHWHTNSGALIISTSETTRELKDTIPEGDSVFIDDMGSTLICNKSTCNFTK
ncbi:winged helix-turn-helix domain-containing protein [Escherichia albertii]|nr:winged helix-turn-helix domain-containing protein [Escherichia albertii]